MYMKILQRFPSESHRLLNSIFLATLDRPMQNEDSTLSYVSQVFHALWQNMIEMLSTEEDAKIYEETIAKLYIVSKNESGDETDLFECWSSFWNTIGLRFPQASINHIETLLIEFIDHNHINLMNLLQV